MPIISGSVPEAVTVSGAVDQGAPGGAPWPVDGTVNVGNLPATQPVSGTVEVDGTITVDGSGVSPATLSASMLLWEEVAV